jgi:folate-binding protein YgfZ
MFYTHLTDRRLLSISGSEAIAFLQGLITQDASQLEQGQPVYAALLTPQGRYLHDFFIYPVSDALWLDVHKDRLADLMARLRLYKLRSDVQLEALSEEIGVSAVWGQEDAPQHAQCFADPRWPAMGWRAVGYMEQRAQWLEGYEEVGEAAYALHRLQQGVPDGVRDMQIERSLMLESNMDALHAVSFTKGCYVGQEVTARSKHRGQVRKRLYSVKATTGALPDAGAPIMLEGKEVGVLRSHQQGYGLALVRCEVADALVESTADSLQAGDAHLQVSNPAYMQQT